MYLLYKFRETEWQTTQPTNKSTISDTNTPLFGTSYKTLDVKQIEAIDQSIMGTVTAIQYTLHW